jgi:hypothetical protein
MTLGDMMEEEDEDEEEEIDIKDLRAKAVKSAKPEKSSSLCLVKICKFSLVKSRVKSNVKKIMEKRSKS